MKNSLFVGIFALLITFSINGQDEKFKKKETKLQDPVCHMKVKKDGKITAKHKETEYVFCSESCKDSFVKNPDKYIKK